jgi:predicted porin
MKKTHLAHWLAGLAGLACSAAHAQSSVTLYGLLDTGIEFINHASAKGGDIVQESTGGLSNSRWGMRGTEDLGSGNSAFFILEAGIDSNNGAEASSGVLFNRTAEVGLSNATYGAVSLGLQYSAMYDILIDFDPMNYAPHYTWFPTAGSSDDFSYTARVDNSVKYTGHFGGFTTIAEYSFGGVAGSLESNAGYGAGLRYDYGSFAAAAAYDYRNGTITTGGAWTKTSNWSLSAMDTLGRATLLGGYEHYLYEPVTGAQTVDGLWFAGTRVQITPANKLTLAYYYQQNDTPKVSNSWMTVLSDDYALSKRTDLYATLAYAESTRNGNGSYTPVGVTDATAFADNQTGIMLGIRHRF